MSGEARLPLPRDPRPAEDAGVWWCEGGTPLRGPAHVELPQFLPLTQFYIGRFASTNHSVLFLWVRGSGADKSLVIVVVQDQTKPQPARTLRRFKLALRDCPFFAPLVVGDETKRPFRGICAFEVRLSDIQGLDYLNPLIVNASRLVVEAKRLTKRWFPTLGHCARHYSWDPPSLEPSRDRKARVESLLSELYRPRARSEAQWEAEEEPHEEEEEVVSLPQVVPRSEFCSRGAAAEPRSYVLDNWEEKNYETLNRLVLGAERMLRVKSEVHEAKRSPPSAQSTPCRCRRAPAQSGPCRCRRARPVQTQEAEPEPEPSFVEVIHNTTVCVRFDDPFLPYVLREVMHDPEHPHLLRLYESGLPSWAIYLPQYLGGFYRRWMRVAFSMLLLVLSCVSLLLGLYDLFSTFPSLHRTLKGILLMPICKWMEEVVAAKWAVLLGWLLPYQTLVRYFRSSFQLCASCAAYFVSSLSFFFYSTVSWSVPTLLPWVEFVVEPLGGVLCAGFALVRSLVVVIRGVLAACRGGVWSAAAGLGRLFSSPGGGAPITTMGLLSMQANAFRKACMGIYHGTIYFCVLVAKHQASLRLAIRRCLRRMWRYVASAVSRMPVCAGLFALAATALLVLALCKGAPPGLPEHGAAPGGGAGTGGHAVGHEPAVLAVDLLCASSAPERCWDPRRGGARCGCPYRDLRALNVTLGHPGTVSFEVPPHRFPNGSATRQVRCRGPGHCLVPARSLRNIFAGGAAEVWAMGSPRAAGRLAAPSGVAAFVLEAPRPGATAPADVRLCLERRGRGSAPVPWAAAVPACAAEAPGRPAVLRAAAGDQREALKEVLRAARAHDREQGAQEQQEAASGAHRSPSGAAVRASWVSGEPGSCRGPRWEVWLNPGSRTGALLCSRKRPRGPWRAGSPMSCAGHVPDELGLESVRAAVLLKCSDAADAPGGPGLSPAYGAPWRHARGGLEAPGPAAGSLGALAGSALALLRLLWRAALALPALLCRTAACRRAAAALALGALPALARRARARAPAAALEARGGEAAPPTSADAGDTGDGAYSTPPGSPRLRAQPPAQGAPRGPRRRRRNTDLKVPA